MEYWLTALFNLMEYFAMLIFFDSFFERRAQKQSFWGVFFVFCAAAFCFVSFVHVRLSLIKIVGCAMLFLLMNFALYRGTVKMRLLITATGYVMLYLLGFIFDLAVLTVSHLSYEEYVNNGVLYVVTCLGSNLLLIMLALLVWHYHKPRDLSNPRWASVAMLFPIASLMLLFPISSLFHNSTQEFPLLLLCVTILTLANVGVIILVDWMERSTHAQERTLAVSERLAAQEQSMEALSAAYSMQRQITHDFRHHLDALSDLLSANAPEEALRYLSELQEQQTERVLVVNTHHAAVDAVLNQKALYAQKRAIDIQFEVNDLSALKIREVDCTVVLANLLDNAIEACEKLMPADRWIEVKALLENAAPPEMGTLFISIVNASPPVKIVGERIETTKKNPSLHGFGLANVAEILSRYHAESVMNYQDGAFQFSLEWPNRQP